MKSEIKDGKRALFKQNERTNDFCESVWAGVCEHYIFGPNLQVAVVLTIRSHSLQYTAERHERPTTVFNLAGTIDISEVFLILWYSIERTFVKAVVSGSVSQLLSSLFWIRFAWNRGLCASVSVKRKVKADVELGNYGRSGRRIPVDTCLRLISDKKYTNMSSFVRYSVTATEQAASIAVPTSRNDTFGMPIW